MPCIPQDKEQVKSGGVGKEKPRASRLQLGGVFPLPSVSDHSTHPTPPLGGSPGERQKEGQRGGSVAGVRPQQSKGKLTMWMREPGVPFRGCSRCMTGPQGQEPGPGAGAGAGPGKGCSGSQGWA